ncbi:hypothetical protein K493DRAFT_11282 [Basidiobolus meristosporus CBS 931.73]|uniref:Carbohydrate-binding module family 19 domain-containing protein n=1 Tax=Basidiobolus meristosporus CBS 931.73 TaxID=1314790 RepID=A0A1Y1VRT5_9FUNG|nr:hypothetical protein K493DRAFT_11282 [Basidiobolus meristosporus CBS 931.73]|eukprot:ORX63998.1 hypothetical protein K493DRAFT_11282 [Basidiobolus meristosporus CBS 931.73]
MNLAILVFISTLLAFANAQFFDEDLRREGYDIPVSPSQPLYRDSLRFARRKVCKYNPGAKPTTHTTKTSQTTTRTTKTTSRTTKTTTRTTKTTTRTTETTARTTKTTTRTTHKPSQTTETPTETPSCPVPGGPCHVNELRCSGYAYAQCNLGRWTLRDCSKDGSMICVEAGASLFCGPSRNYVLRGCSGVPK